MSASLLRRATGEVHRGSEDWVAHRTDCVLADGARDRVIRRDERSRTIFCEIGNPSGTETKTNLLFLISFRPAFLHQRSVSLSHPRKKKRASKIPGREPGMKPLTVHSMFPHNGFPFPMFKRTTAHMDLSEVSSKRTMHEVQLHHHDQCIGIRRSAPALL